MAKNRELRPHELAAHDWKAIEIVTDWLLMFRKITTIMSASKTTSTLSYVQAVFTRLQNDVKEKLSSLPQDTPRQLKEGLIAAHTKLSDYFSIYDGSPYYVWASSELTASSILNAG